MTAALSVNINKVALLRNSRAGNFPDLLAYAQACITAGADGITVHPRPDQRHIRASDILPLAALIHMHTGIEFNIEGNPFAQPRDVYPGLVALVEQARPHQCTLVPDSDKQLTSDHGFNLALEGDNLRPLIARLKSTGCRVSLFMDPDCEQISLAQAIGADSIELYTGPYADACHAQTTSTRQHILGLHKAACEHALALGLSVNAGHDLNLDNLSRYAQALPGLREVSIGHALTVDALTMGLNTTIQAYKAVLKAPVTAIDH